MSESMKLYSITYRCSVILKRENKCKPNKREVDFWHCVVFIEYTKHTCYCPIDTYIAIDIHTHTHTYEGWVVIVDVSRLYNKCLVVFLAIELRAQTTKSIMKQCVNIFVQTIHSVWSIERTSFFWNCWIFPNRNWLMKFTSDEDVKKEQRIIKLLLCMMIDYNDWISKHSWREEDWLTFFWCEQQLFYIWYQQQWPDDKYCVFIM